MGAEEQVLSPAPFAGVAQTAVLTLRARADEHSRADRLFADPLAAEWMARLAWPDALDPWYADGAQNNVALRVDDIDRLLVRVTRAPGASASDGPADPEGRRWTVVELGGGLSTRAARLADVIEADWVCVDLPDIAALRRTWSAPGRTVAASVLDPAWLPDLGDGPPVFVAEGLLYYLPRPDVDDLLRRLGARFPGAVLIMDVLGAHDFPKLAAHTTVLGAPVKWHLQPPFTDVLPAFGLDAIAGFEPDDIAREALARYLPRLSSAVRVLSWWALHTGVLPPNRSGNVVGRLRP